MKKVLAGAVVAACLLPSGAHAAATQLAYCNGSAPALTGFPSHPAVSFLTSCRNPFYIGSTTLVTAHLTPSTAFVGTLSAILRRVTPADSREVRAIFVAGNVVSGAGSATFTLTQGNWELEVRAGGSSPCMPLPSPANCPALAAVGDFSGDLTTG